MISHFFNPLYFYHILTVFLPTETVRSVLLITILCKWNVNIFCLLLYVHSWDSCVPFSLVPATASLQITEQPQSQAVAPGSAVTLHCRASGPTSDDITYMWYINGLSLPQDTKPDFLIPTMTEEDEGMYSCEVSTGTSSLMFLMATISLIKWLFPLLIIMIVCVNPFVCEYVAILLNYLISPHALM